MGEARLATAPAGADEVALGSDDEGLGNARPDEVVPLDLDDDGLGNIRPDIIHVEAAR